MRHWVAIPNFVDTVRFRPCADAEERRRIRREWEVPEDAFVVGSAVALKRHHKRVDCLIGECGQLSSVISHSSDANSRSPMFLLVAGARTEETEVLQAMASERLGNRARLVPDVPRESMPSFYRCLDVFVLPSLFEMMPIAVLEAMASGVPVIANHHPVLEWMVGSGEGVPASGGAGGCRVSGIGGQDDDQQVSGPRSNVSGLGSTVSSPGGVCIDMAREGALAETLHIITPERLVALGKAARKRAERVFSREVVIRQYVDYYRRVSSV